MRADPGQDRLNRAGRLAHPIVSPYDSRKSAPADQPWPRTPRGELSPHGATRSPSQEVTWMIRKTSMLSVALAAALLLAAPFALAAPTTWNIDTSHSSVDFSVRHLFSKVPGKFTKFSGTIVYDPANPAASSVKAEIDA